MNRPLLAATASIALTLALAACGSVTDIDNLFDQNSGGAAATTTGQGGAPGVTGVGGSISSATTNPASVSASSGPTTASGPTTTGPEPAGSSASGPGVTASASTGPSGPASSSSGGPTSTVFCNNAECAPGQICCFNLSQPTDHCGEEGACGDGFIELQCNGPEDCPGGVCCADVDLQKNPPYKSISCQQSCNNPQNNLIVCSDADPTCPFGKQCGTSMVLGQGYKICK